VTRTWQLTSSKQGATFDLRFGLGVHTLGSTTDNDLCVSDPTVSRCHARLTCTEDGVTIEDLGSTNGTEIDGKPVNGPIQVDDHAKLKFGRLVFEFAEMVVESREEESHGPVSSSGASVLLGPATVGFLRDAGEEVGFNEGDVIVRRGEKQSFFYVVIAGEVELRLSEGEGHGRPLARLDEGGIFGAESVLGKAGAAVDAVAVTDVRLLRYPASELPTALKESASLRRKLLGGFARHLHKTTSDALDLMHGAEVMARLVQGDNDPDDLVAASPRMKAIKKKVAAFSETDDPVLILGEDGTGKTLIARLVHDGSPRAQGPLIAVNCRDLTPGHAAELILGEDLGGRLPAGERASGGIHLAHGGTIVLRGADDLEPAAQHLISAHLRGEHQRGPNAYPNTRFIITAREASSGEGKAGLTNDLTECFDDAIEIPPLGKRLKDILPLAEEHMKRQGPKPPVITEGARHALLSLKYQRRNVAELKEILDLAVRVAEGDEIRAEHIFGGVGEEDLVPGMDVTETPLMKRVLAKVTLPVLRVATLFGFAAVIVLCLVSAASAFGRTANTAIWSLWEPVVFGLFFVAGPVWCTICPLSTAARWAKKLHHSNRPPPERLIRHGPWMAIVGFALIIWVERVFNSAENPVASGLLLLSLVVAAVTFSLLFRREVWCRHLCPLGRLATTLAPASPLQMVAKSRVCASTCTTHACYRGTPEIAGCTVFHHPLEGKQAYRCKLCLDCLQSCPHHSANLQLRPPLMAVWRLDSSAADLSVFALTVTLLALGLVAARSFGVLATPLNFTLLFLFTIVAGVALHSAIMALAATDRRKAIMIRLGMSLMILGWAALMTSQLANIVVLNDAWIVLPPSDLLPSWMPSELSLLAVLQVGLVLFGLFLALVSLTHVNFRGTSVWTRLGSRIAPMVFVAYAFGVVVLLIF
jgi:transcriptional regulator with AAA-type ATPase domain/pSer/pThr/pTyr-binding forkhead associated (FHA) protein